MVILRNFLIVLILLVLSSCECEQNPFIICGEPATEYVIKEIRITPNPVQESTQLRFTCYLEEDKSQEGIDYKWDVSRNDSTLSNDTTDSCILNTTAPDSTGEYTMQVSILDFNDDQPVDIRARSFVVFDTTETEP